MKVDTETVELPDSLKRQAARLAALDGISLSQWVALAVAQKVGATETAAQFFRQRGLGTATLNDAMNILNSGPNDTPVPGDELPEDCRPANRA